MPIDSENDYKKHDEQQNKESNPGMFDCDHESSSLSSWNQTIERSFTFRLPKFRPKHHAPSGKNWVSKYPRYRKDNTCASNLCLHFFR